MSEQDSPPSPAAQSAQPSKRSLTSSAAPLTGRVARGAAWIMASGAAARLLGAANTIIVARLLVPADIGLVAVASLAMQLLQGFTDIGVSQAVVKFQDADRKDLNTLFTFSFLRGVLAALILVAAAPFMGALYNDPRMAAAFFGIAFYPLLIGAVNPRFFEFQREMRFSREFIAAIATKLAGVAVSIAIALIFRSFWAIILGMLAGAAVQVVLSYLMRPFAPRFSFESAKKVFGFSGWLAGVSFVTALNNKLDTPILARWIGTAGGGIYFMGAQLSDLVAGQIATPMSRALYPGLALLQNDRERMRRAYLSGVGAIAAAGLPAAVGFAFVAEDATALLLGSQWGGVVPVIQILAPVAGLQTLFYAAQPYAMAAGKTRLVFYRELIYLAIRLPIFIWAVAAHGLMGAAGAAGGLGVFHCALNLALYARVAARPFWEPLAHVHRYVIGVAVMSVWLWLWRGALGGAEDWSAIMRLIFDMVSGAGLYALCVTGLWLGEGRPGGAEANLLRAIAVSAAHLRVNVAKVRRR